MLKKITGSLLAVALLLSFGCASGGGGAKGPSDEELIQQLVTTTLEALQGKDVDTTMAAYSDSFTSDQGDKAAMQAFFQQAAEAGFLDGMTASTESMSITVDGDTAEVAGISVEGAFGALDLTFGLAKEDGRWMITSQTQ